MVTGVRIPLVIPAVPAVPLHKEASVDGNELSGGDALDLVFTP